MKESPPWVSLLACFVYPRAAHNHRKPWHIYVHATFLRHPLQTRRTSIRSIQTPIITCHPHSSSSSSLPRFPLGPSFRIGIFIPCVAKHLLSGVLSITPGNFLALKTWKMSLKAVARTGAEPVCRVDGLVGEAMFTKFIFKLGERERGQRSCMTVTRR